MEVKRQSVSSSPSRGSVPEPEEKRVTFRNSNVAKLLLGEKLKDAIYGRLC